jgi:hypothetical protein
MSQTRPAVSPNEIEWAFRDGQPSIVVHIPDGKGYYSVYEIARQAPESHYEREHVRALLRIAERVMADSEPTVLTAMTSRVAR